MQGSSRSLDATSVAGSAGEALRRRAEIARLKQAAIPEIKNTGSVIE
jgi:hypothetical protein